MQVLLCLPRAIEAHLQTFVHRDKKKVRAHCSCFLVGLFHNIPSNTMDMHQKVPVVEIYQNLSHGNECTLNAVAYCARSLL